MGRGDVEDFSEGASVLNEGKERVLIFVDVESGFIVGCVDEDPEDYELSTEDFIEKYEKFFDLRYGEVDDDAV